MIRRSLPFIAAIAIITILFLAFFMKATFIYSVEVPFPITNAMDHMRDTRKISRWMEPFATDKNNKLIVMPQSMALGKDSLQIINQGFIDMVFRRTNGSNFLVYSIQANVPANNAAKTNFILSFTTTPWKKYIMKNPLAAEATRNMDAFSDYMKNPVRVYGYDIREILVTDTSFLFASRTVPEEKFTAETKSLFDMLILEASKRNAGYNGVRIFHSQLNGDGTISLFAGVGVTKMVFTSETDIVSFKIMPAKKKLLVADYEGPYKDIHKVYEAMELYKGDNKRISMAIPFEKYISDGYGFADTQVVKMRVSFPVF
jgi:effector-binding domain-containing protein